VILVSTHQLDAAEKLCDDILLINKGKKVLDGNLASIKGSHGKNAVQIEYDGNGDFLKSQATVEDFDDYGNYMEVILKKEADPNDLLKALVEKFKIRRFECTTSSLKEIFLANVMEAENV